MKKTILSILTFLVFAAFSQAQISSANLLAHYKLDANGKDSSGNGLHATNYNTIGGTDRFGKIGGATYFNGVDGYMLVPASNKIQPSDSISICVWINQEQKSNIGWSTVIDKRYEFLSDPWSSYGISTHPDYANKWMFSVSSGTVGSAKTTMAKSSNPYNAWTLIVGTYNKSQLKLYINGVLDTTIAKTGSLGYSSLDLHIGYSGTGPNEYFKGRMDDIRIYGRVLSAAEIQNLYSAPNAIEEQIVNKPAFAIYPNPANNVLRIDTEQKWKSASIYDVLGKLVWVGDFNAEINLDFLKEGYYHLTLTDENQNSIAKQFIKQ